jgi:hypothetical protein
MPTVKPRVNVTLTVTDYELLSTLARQQKRSRADMLRDLFETMRPVLERVAVVSEAAQRAQAQAKQGLIDSAEKAEAELQPLLDKALGQFDLFITDVQKQTAGASAERRTQGASAPPQTPVPVITGVRSSRTVGKTPRKVSRKGPRKKAARSARRRS